MVSPRPASSSHAPGLDLSACENEPIRVPGSIQPHGLLLAFDAHSFIVTHLSQNAGAALGQENAGILGQDMSEMMELESGYTDGDIDTNPTDNPHLNELGDRRYSRRQTIKGGVLLR